MATQELIAKVKEKRLVPETTKILDAGCGQGELSVWLAANGYKVYGIDISEEACKVASALAKTIGVNKNIKFLANSLEQIEIDDEVIDFIIGHASLHHFIKYEKVSDELNRVLKAGGEMFFADSFGENFFYHVFHNKKKMQRLGDVILTRTRIQNFFNHDNLELEIIPYDWFSMFDKLFLKLFPSEFEPVIRKVSRLWWTFDRAIPVNSFTLWLSGSVMTHVTKQ